VKGGGGFFHRQTDDVGKRACDAGDNFATMTLRGVGSGLVQRIHFQKVIVDLAIS